MRTQIDKYEYLTTNLNFSFFLLSSSCSNSQSYMMSWPDLSCERAEIVLVKGGFAEAQLFRSGGESPGQPTAAVFQFHNPV